MLGDRKLSLVYSSYWKMEGKKIETNPPPNIICSKTVDKKRTTENININNLKELLHLLTSLLFKHDVNIIKHFFFFKLLIVYNSVIKPTEKRKLQCFFSL